MRAARAGLIALAATAALVAGCRMVGAAAYYLGPRRMQKAEFKLTEGRLAIVIETTRSGQEHPLFHQALHEKLVELFRENKVPSEVVPYAELAQLERTDADFRSWSLQRIGRAVNADQILYVRLDQLVLRETPEHPVIAPAVSLRLKIVAVNEPAVHARLWPEQLEGREVSCSRPAEEAVSPAATDAAAKKLGYDTAQIVARFFFDYDLEQRVPKEP